MAAKQKPRGLNRFLDLIGLVDNERDEDAEQNGAAARGASRRTATRDEFDDFGDFDAFEEPAQPRQRTSAPSGSRNRGRVNLEDDSDEFGDESWTNTRRSTASSRSTAAYQAQQPRGTASSRSGYTPGSYRTQNAQSTQSGASSSRTASSRTAGGYTRYTDGGDKSYRSGEYDSYYSRSSSASSRYGAAAHAAEEGPRASAESSRQQTVVCTLHSIEECKDVILALVDKKTILLNLDRLEPGQAQRAVDTMCGATYAIGATLTRASERAWLLTPSTVEVTSTDSGKYQ